MPLLAYEFHMVSLCTIHQLKNITLLIIADHAAVLGPTVNSLASPKNMIHALLIIAVTTHAVGASAGPQLPSPWGDRLLYGVLFHC